MLVQYLIALLIFVIQASPAQPQTKTKVGAQAETGIFERLIFFPGQQRFLALDSITGKAIIFAMPSYDVLHTINKCRSPQIHSDSRIFCIQDDTNKIVIYDGSSLPLPPSTGQIDSASASGLDISGWLLKQMVIDENEGIMVVAGNDVSDSNKIKIAVYDITTLAFIQHIDPSPGQVFVSIIPMIVNYPDSGLSHLATYLYGGTGIVTKFLSLCIIPNGADLGSFDQSSFDDKVSLFSSNGSIYQSHDDDKLLRTYKHPHSRGYQVNDTAMEIPGSKLKALHTFSDQTVMMIIDNWASNYSSLLEQIPETKINFETNNDMQLTAATFSFKTNSFIIASKNKVSSNPSSFGSISAGPQILSPPQKKIMGPNNANNPNIGLIVGVTIGSVVFAILVILLIVCLIRIKRRKQQSTVAVQPMNSVQIKDDVTFIQVESTQEIQ